MVKKLVEIKNEKATNLFNELKQEIKEIENNKKVTLFNPIAKVLNNIGTFESTRILGNCKQHRENGTITYFQITLNKELVNNGTDKQIKDVLIHEMIHCLSGCQNHKYNFKNKCNIYEYYTNYNALNQTFKNCTKTKPTRNIVYKCNSCGKEYPRCRHINTTQYRCKCGGGLELLK